jgi:hypothetical protein
MLKILERNTFEKKLVKFFFSFKYPSNIIIPPLSLIQIQVKIFVVDFMGDLSGATALYEASDIIEVIDGETFCQRIKIDYQTIINDLKLSQNHNKNFIKEFKKIEVC